MSEKITPFRRGAKWTDPDTLDTLNRLIAAANTTGELTGDGTITVSRSPAGGRSVGISVAKLIPQIPKPLPIRWGKATATWTTGNTVVLDPCDVAGNDIPYESNVTGYVISPMADSPDSSIDPEITIGNVLAYLPFWSADVPPLACGVILNAKWVPDFDAFKDGADLFGLRSKDIFLDITQNTAWTDIDTLDWRGAVVGAHAWWNGGGPPSLDGSWNQTSVELWSDVGGGGTWYVQGGLVTVNFVTTNDMVDTDVARIINPGGGVWCDMSFRIAGADGNLQVKVENWSHRTSAYLWVLSPGNRNLTAYVTI